MKREDKFEIHVQIRELPKDPELQMDINSAASRPYNKLRYFDIDPLDTSDYNKRYAKVIGEEIGNQADYYVQGGIVDVIRVLRTNTIPCTLKSKKGFTLTTDFTMRLTTYFKKSATTITKAQNKIQGI